MEANDLGADQVVAGLEPAGDGDAVAALVGDQLVDGPDTAAEALGGDFGPDGAVAVAGGGGDVDLDGALVGLDIIWHISKCALIAYISINRWKASWGLTAAMISSLLTSWYHSNSNVAPVATVTEPPTALVPATLQLMALLVMSLTGLLLGGERT